MPRTCYHSPTMEERWAAVFGFEGWYDASSHGRVRAIKRPVKGGIRRKEPYPIVLTPLWYRKGYYKIQFGRCDNTRKRRRLFIHRVVWEAFNGPIPGRITVNHKDGNPGNNRLDNLELATFAEQYHHAADIGLTKKRKMTPEKIRELRRLHSEGWTQSALARRYDMRPSNVRWILTGRSWRHVT